MSTEVSRFYRLIGGRLEAMHARFATHRYPRHAHEYFVLGFVPQGVQSYSYRGSKHITPPGDLFLVNPEEPHTGESANGATYTLQSIYPKVELVDEVAEDLGCSGRPFFRDAVVRDHALASLLARAHTALCRGGSTAQSERLVLESIAVLISKYGVPRADVPEAAKESARVRIAREYMEQRFAEDVSLYELANLVSLSPYYFARSFEREVGLPPHTYIENIRIRRACELLERGQSIASVSLSVGYSDQAHFTHRFKRFLGVTPGQFARNR